MGGNGTFTVNPLAFNEVSVLVFHHQCHAVDGPESNESKSSGLGGLLLIDDEAFL